MFVILIISLASVAGEKDHDVHFILNAIGANTCATDSYLCVTSLKERNSDIMLHLPRRPEVGMMKGIARYGHWTNITLPHYVRMKEYDMQDDGLYDNFNHR